MATIAKVENHFVFSWGSEQIVIFMNPINIGAKQVAEVEANGVILRRHLASNFVCVCQKGTQT
jgi:hypothetical protein